MKPKPSSTSEYGGKCDCKEHLCKSSVGETVMAVGGADISAQATTDYIHFNTTCTINTNDQT